MSNFLPWLNDNQVSENTVSVSSYATLTDRTGGYRSGSQAVAANMNTVLRQCSLVAAAIMDTIGEWSSGYSEYSHLTPFTNVKTAVASYLTDAFKLSVGGTKLLDISGSGSQTQLHISDVFLKTMSDLTPGQYGSVNSVTQIPGGTFNIPCITVDAKGRVTSIKNTSITAVTGGVTSQDISNVSSSGTSDSFARADHTHKGVKQVVLNGETVLDPDFYAPTSSGSAGQVLISDGEDAEPVWSDINTLDILDKTYPVGSIYMSVNDTSPASLFGGTWQRWGQGRVPVSIDTTQTEFNSVEKTGGEKTHSLTTAELAQHSHTERLFLEAFQGSPVIEQYFAMASRGPYRGTGVYINTANIVAMDASYYGDYVDTATEGSNRAHNNLQPYITCYMWKRTA